MKKSNKKFIASLLAISLAAPVFSGIPVFAENSDGTIVDQTQPLTVVGKRITGDDTYFEISLEVNGDYDEYSSVGVVLRYDPDYIIPAESWDEDAGAADMSENTSWATRRALPTLGLETWSTHTALAYQEDAPAAGSAKKYGYLYLGAEHPLGVETPAPDPSASPDPTADPSASTPEPTASPTPGTRPVVVARFMYNTDAAAVPPVTGKDTREKLENDWLNGVNGSGAAQPTNWDYDWTSNAILRIASDEVSGKSPAQYPFAIYTQDYEEKAYMETWPAVTPTVTPAPGAPTPTPMPVSAYAPVIGAGIDTANRLTKDDIMVITCVGESAKATGGLKLSDIYLILFYDWDDTLLGTLTAGVGLDMTADVSNYIDGKFVHPELRSTNVGGSVDYTSIVDGYTETTREYSYRGEYEYAGPGTGNTFPDYFSDGTANPDAGSKYPITNKLDYTLAGKDLDPEHPFANGWTQVLLSEYDFDPDGDYAGDPTCDYMMSRPKLMSETWTSFSWATIQKLVDEFDSSGYFVNGLNWIDPDVPFAVDFSNITSEQLECSDGNLYVKAMYNNGDLLDSEGNYYTSPGPVRYTSLSVIDDANAVYSITFPYRRVSEGGFGVTRARKPVVRTDLMPDGGSGTYVQPVTVENKEKFDVQIVLSRGISSVEDYFLVDGYGANVASGNQISSNVENWNPGFGPFYIDSWDYPYPSGYRVDCALGSVVDLALADDIASLNYYALQEAGIKRSDAGADFTRATHLTTAIKRNITNFVLDAQADWIANHLDEPDNTVPIITYYQLQWAVLNSGQYVDAATAEANCQAAGYSWCI